MGSVVRASRAVGDLDHDHDSDAEVLP